MEYPHNMITGKGSNEDVTANVYIYVQSEFFAIDEAALAQAVQQWLLDHTSQVVSTTAIRREQVFPITQLPSLPG